jgi:hypothetical protein
MRSGSRKQRLDFDRFHDSNGVPNPTKIETVRPGKKRQFSGEGDIERLNSNNWGLTFLKSCDYFREYRTKFQTGPSFTTHLATPMFRTENAPPSINQRIAAGKTLQSPLQKIPP